MTKIEELRDSLSKFTNDKLSPEQLKGLAEIGKIIDDVEKESKEAKDQYHSLQSDYINLIKNTGFKNPSDDGNGGDKQPPTFEEILEQTIANRGKEK